MKSCITLSLLIQLNGQIYTKLLTVRSVINVLIILSMLMMSKNSINKLKPGKSDGFDGISSDYLINASPLFCVFIIFIWYHVILLFYPKIPM